MKSWNIAMTWTFRPSNSGSGDLPFPFEMFLHLVVSPDVLSSNMWTGVGRTLCKVSQVTIVSEWNQTMTFNHLPPELRDRKGSRQRCMERIQRPSAAGTVSKSTVASIIVTIEKVWNNQNISYNWSSSKMGERILLRGVTKNPKVEPYDWAPETPIADGRTF